MNQIELAADMLKRTEAMMKNTLADFSDADMMVRTCAGANHSAWQLGHLCGAVVFFLHAAGAKKLPALPDGWREKYNSKTTSIDDPKAFDKKDELLKQFSQANAVAIEFALQCTPAEFEKPSSDALKDFAPTIGHVILTLSTHASMHIGQMQAIRRKLGKPILF